MKEVLFSTNAFPFNIYLSCLLQGFLFELKESFSLLKVCSKDNLHTIALAYLYPKDRFLLVSKDKEAKKVAELLGLRNISFFEKIEENIPKVDIAILEKDYISELDLIREKLPENGILYVNYIALPGSLPICTFWNFIRMLVPEDRFSSSEERAKKALYFLRLLFKRGMIYLQENPSAVREIRYYLDDNIEEFTYEVLSEKLRPFFFYEIYEKMKNKGFEFLGSANVILNEIELCVPPSQVPTFFELTDVVLVETVKDFIRNTKEREDLFSKSISQDYSKAFQILEDKEIKIFPSVPVTELIRVLQTLGGRIPLKGPIYDRIFQAFENGKQFITLTELKDFPERQILKALIRILATGEFIISLNEPKDIAWLKDFKKIEIVPEINQFLLEEAISKNKSYVILISEISKGVIKLNLSEAYIIAEMQENEKILEKIEQRLKKDEIKVKEEQKMVFMKRKLPLLAKLGIVKQIR